MEKLAKRLEDEKYLVANIDYPSTEYPVERLTEIAVEDGLHDCQQNRPDKIHFVTHSLGGILVRYYLKHNRVENLGRVVMLGPPNHGSEVVDKLKKFPGFSFINGPAGLQLGTGNETIPNSLGKADFEVGIIAGTRSINLILSTMITSENDGKVSLESAHLEGETDFKTLPTTHTFMMLDDQVIDNVLSFLKEGRFLEDKPADHARACNNAPIGC